MKKICAAGLEYNELNSAVRASGRERDRDIEITECLGQRFIAAGLGNRRISIYGTPGNALGAYLNGAEIVVHGNAQDAVGDTMNAGEIAVHGNIGDAAGYAMRGGRIYVKGNAGYRAGIHMKEYGEKKPVMIIGGSCGSFLGEYQAGGVIIVLGLGADGKIVGEYPCTGMHGGKMFLRSDCKGIRFPANVNVRQANNGDMDEIYAFISPFCDMFGLPKDEMMNHAYTVIVPDTKNPYKQMYVAN